MKCLKCGNELKDNEIMCSNCGYNRYNTPEQDNQFATRNIGVYNQNPVDKEEVEKKSENQKQFDQLVETYIGSMYYNFRKGTFSLWAFLFGPLYFLYRKLYAVAILLYIGSFAISGFFTFTTQGRYLYVPNIKSLLTLKGFSTYFIIYVLVFLIIRIFLGKTFKKFYFDEVVERIGKLKKNNPNLGFNQLLEVAKQKGGTNILAPILVLLIPIVLMIIILLMGIVAINSLIGLS